MDFSTSAPNITQIALGPTRALSPCLQSSYFSNPCSCAMAAALWKQCNAQIAAGILHGEEMPLGGAPAAINTCLKCGRRNQLRTRTSLAACTGLHHADSSAVRIWRQMCGCGNEGIRGRAVAMLITLYAGMTRMTKAGQSALRWRGPHQLAGKGGRFPA